MDSIYYKLLCYIFHAKPAKLAKVVTYGLGVNSNNIIHNYLLTHVTQSVVFSRRRRDIFAVC